MVNTDTEVVEHPTLPVPPQHPVYNISHAFPQLVSQVLSHVTSVRASNSMTPPLAPQTIQSMPSSMGHLVYPTQYAVPTMAAASSLASSQAFIATPEVVDDNAW
ncbi:hypothetical protein V6N12_047479 [Hibiscus sabdariffa]|uniref:Uncharacterized protein n=1 Tax=Hibiscus sabdariffa TaxID=183260 RepID=A0ABR2DB11_9ROSI